MKINLNDVMYNVEQSGSGFPLLLLHGFTGSIETWYPFLPILKSQNIMIDLLGHGKTESPSDSNRYDIQKAAEDLNLLLDQLDIEKTDVLGYSMGGRLAITFAVLFPNRVRKLILESTTPGLKRDFDRQERRERDAKLANKILSEGVEAFVRHWENIPLFQTQLNLPDKVREQIRNQRMQNNCIGLSNSLLGMGTGSQPSWWETLPTWSFPTLFLAGEWDEKFCKIGIEVASAVPNGLFMKIKNAGHAIHVEETEKFGTIVSEFLSNDKVVEKLK
ncbi:2-succinyl-6-hydroxy-2,4-cyclohexadiene-1-carboxylate synthase [Mesobacillus maritimus]|uniref:2-succinyl-6-hydroxy-2, 4-cyclohexadiene-1-carboxylate synthase n=1 Tax=Mesobacillus maritimus TaxID=1643336 RepID=UPI0020425427|nr:2-succinyl-6-hydroxy-2,4-cyclohexadiene-1-carboxylate synthase [Mesobacillus maritimus]MCM3587987.1 2-succinyl-6-hydroxy-2,4-cyclohexadiene-1-carboxylate synthase [Mesobacillus maritimus]